MVLRVCPTSRIRASSVCVLGLSDAVCDSLSHRQTRDLRFPLKVLACMRRVLDRARSKSVSRYRRSQFCLPLRSTAWAPRSGHRLRDGGSISRLNGWPARTPVNASPSSLRTRLHDSEPVLFATPSLYEILI